MPATLDIVVPVFGSLDQTWRCITHLMAFGPPYQRIILVDDCTPEPEIALFTEVLRNHGHTYLRHKENAGCHAAWNTGLANATAPVVAFINSDIAVGPGCLEQMYFALGKIPNLHYTSAQQTGGEFGPDKVVNPRMSGLAMGDYFNACFMMPTDKVRELDGFDERFRVTYGDTDFLVRYADRGGNTCVVRGAMAYHGGSVSRRRTFGRDEDVARDLKDRELFESKWAARPDVLARHPRESESAMKAGRDECWNRSENLSE